MERLTVQDLPAEFQSGIEAIVAKWKKTHDERGWDWLDIREFKWDESEQGFRAEWSPRQWGKVQRGTVEYENNVPNHSGGWLDELVGEEEPEPSTSMSGYKQDFAEAIKDEVLRYLDEQAATIWPSNSQYEQQDMAAEVWGDFMISL